MAAAAGVKEFTIGEVAIDDFQAPELAEWER
jgi:hypothetical protein